LGSLGGPNAGGEDAFLAKYDASGNLLWTRQTGTPYYDESYSVAVDGLGNAYISGCAGDDGGYPGVPGAFHYIAFLTKYDSTGSLLWTQGIGTVGGMLTNSTQSHSVAVDGLGNAYISGDTDGWVGGGDPNPAGQYDAFLAKYNSSGSVLWTGQIGTTNYDTSYSVAVDGWGNAYISGWTCGSLGGPNPNPPNADAFLAKYDSSGSLLWVRQMGTTAHDLSYSVAVDGSGNAYISGYTEGNLVGPNAGPGDAFLAKYNSSGALLWTRQMGTTGTDVSNSVAVYGMGTVYITGWTYGSLGGPNAGNRDMFLAKFSAPIPEPGTIFMIATAVVGMAAAMRVRKGLRK
jgi:hypothetical protein